MIAQLALAFVLGMIFGISGVIYLGYRVYLHSLDIQEQDDSDDTITEEAALRVALALLEQEKKVALN